MKRTIHASQPLVSSQSQVTPSATQRIQPLATQPAPSMSFEQARQVTWQLKPHYPMGLLLDSGQLKPQDLDWAVTNAYRADVRQAAHVLLTALKASIQVAPSAPPAQRYSQPQVFGSNMYLVQQAQRYKNRSKVLLGIWVILLLLGPVSLAYGYTSRLESGLGIMMVYLTVLSLVTRGLMATGSIYRNYRNGLRGEQAVFQQIIQQLDTHWTIYRNLQLPGRRDDLDMVLVGPSGVVLLEIKAYRNYLRIHKNQWQYRRAARWVNLDRKMNPAYQVSRNAKMLHDFLHQHGIKQYIQRVIVLTTSQNAPSLNRSDIPVWQIDRLANDLCILNIQKPVPMQHQAQIDAVLRSLVSAPTV